MRVHHRRQKQHPCDHNFYCRREAKIKASRQDEIGYKNTQVQDDYSKEGSRLWLCVDHDERDWCLVRRSTIIIFILPLNRRHDWSYLPIHRPSRGGEDHIQHWFCIYKQARLIYLASIIHRAKWYLLRRYIGRMSIETKAIPLIFIHTSRCRRG